MSLPSNDWLGLGWTQIWQVTLLIAAVALLTRLAAANRPQLAFVLWLVVLVKCVTPPLWSSPSGVFCWLCPAEATMQSSDETSLATTPTTGVRPLADSLASSISAASPYPATGGRPLASTVVAGRQSYGDESAMLGLSTGIAAVWISGVIVLFIATVWRCARLAAAIRRTSRYENPEYQALLSRLRRQLRLRWPVRVAVTTGAVGPAVFGFLRPTVLLPQAVIEGKTPEQFEPILAHELIHVRRGDHWLGLLRAIVETLWWFHPLVWWAARRSSQEAERCCDEAVLAELQCSPACYARCLLDVLEIKHQFRLVPAFPGMRGIEVTQGRLERIMKIQLRGYKRIPWWCWVVAGLVALVVLPGAALRLMAVEHPAELPAAKRPTDASRDTFYSFTFAGIPTAAPDGVLRTHSATPRPGPTGSSGPQTARTYPAEDVLAVIGERRGLDDPESKAFLKESLRSVVGLARGDLSHRSALDMVWSGNDLIAETTAAGHEQIAKSLDAFRKYGATEISLEARFVSGPDANSTLAETEWTFLSTDAPVIDAPAFPDSSDPSLARPSRPHCYVQSLTDKPVLCQILAKDFCSHLFDQWAKQPRTNVLEAPKVTVFNGQTAMVFDSSESPFVVGLRNGQPQIRVVSEGTILRVRPILETSERIKLEFSVTLSKIGEVHTVTAATEPGGRPVLLQAPEVKTTYVDAGVELPPTKCLLLGGLHYEREKGKPEPMFILLRAEKVERSKSAAVQNRPANPSVDRDQLAQGQHQDGLPGPL